MSPLTLPAEITEQQQPDGVRVWLLGDTMVLRAVPKFVLEVLTWTVTLFGVNSIAADVTVAADDLDLTAACWCTLVVAAAVGGLT